MEKPSLEIGNSNWAIKEGELLGYNRVGNDYLPIPITMTRASLGTRVNPEGLVNYAEILGSEEVTDGGFPAGTTAWAVTDGTVTFNNEATFDINSKIRQNIFDIGKVYKFTYEVTENTGGMTLRFYNGAAYTFVDNSVGIHTVYLTATSNTYFYISTLSGTSLTLKSVSVKEATIDNLARVDYTDGTSSLLAEPQRTNDFTQSNDFANVYWSKSSSAIDTSIGTDGIQSNISTSPDGTINADRVNFLLQSDKDIGLAKSIGSSAGVTHSFSGYLKGEGSNIGKDVIIRVKRSSGGSYVAVNKTITLTSIWQRVELDPLTLVTDNIGVRIILSSNDATNCLVYGFQIEEGSYPTSYIPTSGSTVTRNQDIFTRDGIGSLINSTEGVLFVEIAFSDAGRLAILNSDASDDQVVLGFSGTVFCRIRENGANVVTQFVSSANQLNTYYKIAVKYKSGSSAIWVDGNETVVAGTFTLNDLSKILFISEGSRTYGKVKQLQVYKTTDIDLAALTS